MDIKNTMKIKSTIAPAIYNANAVGTGVDRQGFFATAIVIIVGVIVDGVHTVTIEESANNITFTAIAAGGLDGTPTNLASNTNQEIGYLGNKRYIRAVVAASGTTGGNYTIVIANGQARKAPK